MDLQLFKEGGTVWDGAAPLLPALLDSGSPHISRLPKALSPLNRPPAHPGYVLMLFPRQHPHVLQWPSMDVDNLQPKRQLILTWIPPPESHLSHLRHLLSKFVGLGPTHEFPPPSTQPEPTSWLPMSVFTQPG